MYKNCSKVKHRSETNKQFKSKNKNLPKPTRFFKDTLNQIALYAQHGKKK